MSTSVGLSMLVFVTSSLFTYLIMPWLIRYAFRKGCVVTPKDRVIVIPRAIRKASHPYTIPLTGGMAIFLSFVLSMLITLAFFSGLFPDTISTMRFWALLLSGAVMAIMGLADDLYNLSYKLRLLAGFFLTAILLLFTVYGNVFYLPGGYQITIGGLELIVLLFWCTGLANAINLIDGLDGSAAGIMVIATAWLGLITTTDALLVTVVLTSIMASCLAFLAFNFYPAKVFLGSSGTLFLGFVLAVLTIWPPNQYTPNYFFPYAILIFALPLADMALVFFIRLWHKRNPFATDSWHIHDRVLLTGLGRKHSAMVIWSVSFVCGLFAFLSFRGLIPFLLAGGLVAVWLGLFYVVVILSKKRHSY